MTSRALAVLLSCSGPSGRDAMVHSHALQWRRIPDSNSSSSALALGSRGPMAVRGGGGVKPAGASPLAVWRARCFLLTAAACWGTYPVVLKKIYALEAARLPTLFVTAMRYVWLMIFSGTLRLFRPARDMATPAGSRPSAMHPAAVELAVIGFFASAFSVWGVARVPAVTSEMLMATIHGFVPLLSVAIGTTARQRAVGGRTWCACGLAFAAAILSASTNAASGEAAVSSAWAGNASIVCSAFLYGLARVRLMNFVGMFDPDQLNSLRMLYMGSFAVLACLIDVLFGGPSAAMLRQWHLITPAQVGLLALSVFLSGFCGSLSQYHGQKVISAANAQPFLSGTPIFAGFWAWLFLGETVGIDFWASNSLILGGCVLACREQAQEQEVKAS